MSLPQLQSKLQLLHYALAAARVPGGRTLVQQLFDVLCLRLSRNRLGVSEYYDYRLYDQDRVSASARNTFVGNRVDRALMNAVNSVQWRALDEDKLLFSMLMHRVGLPHPKLVAFYGHRNRTVDAGCFLANAEQMADFLRTKMPYPVFSKPVDGYRSRGAVALSSYDAQTDELILGDGQKLSVEKFVADLPKPWVAGSQRTFNGHMFQELLLPSADVLAQVAATGLSTLRMVVLCDLPEPQLFRAIWKIPMQGNMADNFWRRGNVLAEIDPSSGLIRSVIRSLDNGFETLDTASPLGAALIGTQVPQWDAAVRSSIEAAALLPGTRCQHWDVALSECGPVLIELNGLGDLSLLQSAATVGVLDERFKEFLHRLGVVWDWRGIWQTQK